MREILAIIRNERAEQTKAALDSIGVKGVTFINVIGRGKQKGTIRYPDPQGTLKREVSIYIMQQRGLIGNPEDPRYHAPVENELDLGFLSKKMLMIVADDNEVPGIVRAIIQINRSEHKGDGRIFVCPVNDAIRIRTGEHGTKAIV
ncbi:MAG TPA: P-II family nitrogen regulator [Methanoregulaceae archaeon]|nr:P-II family nitrogen regulator [Methanoregulaceae archaeon]